MQAFQLHTRFRSSLSILRWPFDVIDDEESPRHLARVEFQSQCFQDRVDRRSEGNVRLRVATDCKLRVCVLEMKVEFTGNRCFVDDWRTFKTSADIPLGEHIQSYSLGIDFHIRPLS